MAETDREGFSKEVKVEAQLKDEKEPAVNY